MGREKTTVAGRVFRLVTENKEVFVSMDVDQDRLELHFEDDGAEVLEDFVTFVANKRLLSYKKVIHTGGKSGESLWSHVMNLVMVVEKLRPLFELKEREMQCLLLALVVHDLNKLDEYGRLPNGKGIRYAQVTPPENLESALKDLEVDAFFAEWREYLLDIKYLADAHQEKVALVSQHDPKLLEQCRLDYDRLQGPLRYLMKVADVADNSHTGEYASRHEGHIRGKLIKRLNEALQQGSIPHRYRMIGYRLAEFRGLQTNIMHNVMIAFLRAMYGEDACIDLLYHADGTDFLLERGISFTWTPQMQQDLAKKIGQKFADLQAGQLAQFIKAKPSGIAVDQAAIESGASLERIFQTITGVVERKKYSQEWREQRQQAIRGDLEDFLRQGQQQEQIPLAQRVRVLLAEGRFLPGYEEPEQLKRGEFVIAYRNFLKDHRDQACRALKQDAWQRVAHLFHLSEEDYAVSRLIDPYRRGYIMACSLPPTSLEEMMEAALDDLAQLDQQAKIKSASTRKKSATPESDADEEDEQGEMELDVAAIEDYLARHLQIWDDAGMLAMSPVAFHETLSRYVRDAHPERQCCYCGSALKADEWMAVQVPPSIGVQSFSNRLDGGSSREPKRNVCAICRTQFILEKLAWQAHRDKQGKDEVTFYLHLFSYSFLTKPLLDAWWLSIKRLGSSDHKALFLKTRDYFSEWEKAYQDFQHPVSVISSGIHGLGIPTFPEAISNTPILPLHIPGDNAGSQFLLALEKTLILANWFDCRVLLSRLPTPLLNLEQERLTEHEESVPVALLVENVPSAMNWLLPRNMLTRAEVEILCKQLSLLHQITEQIVSPDEHVETVIYRLISAAARDPLALYYEIDRQIERIISRQKGGNSEQRALSLSARVAPLIETLLHLQEEGVIA